MRKTILAAALFLSLSTSVFAETEPSNPDPIVAYRAYEVAVSAGNLREASEHANRAWQLAEAKWGGTNANTASLAYNAAWSAALVGSAADRIDAARRAVALADLGKEAYDVREANFLLAYAEFQGLPKNERRQRYAPLLRAIEPVEASWADPLVLDALIEAGSVSVRPGNGLETIALANRALAVIERTRSQDGVYKAMALVNRGQGRLFLRRDQDEATADFVAARIAYGPSKGPNDANWGKLAAWEAISNAVVLSNNYVRSETGTHISQLSRRPMELSDSQYREINGRDKVECTGIRRDASVGREVTYPEAARLANVVSGVLVRLDFAPDGTAQNVRLLGAVPADGDFAANTVDAIRTWKFTLPASLPTQCMTDFNIPVSFVLQ